MSEETKLQKYLRNTSLKTKLVLGFIGVVVSAATLISIVFSVFLVATMKKSTKEKIRETARVAENHLEDTIRGLEVYADLISSDRDFGQMLSFDSSFGIEQSIGKFKELSQADLVAFIPRPGQYFSIKDQIFLSTPNEKILNDFKTHGAIRQLLTPAPSGDAKGWIRIGESTMVFSLKPVDHFGANMGLIFLGNFSSDEMAKKISDSTGTGIVLLGTEKTLGSSLEKTEGQDLTPQQKRYTGIDQAILAEEYFIQDQPYLSYFSPITGFDGSNLGSLAILVSAESIVEARNKTLLRVIFAAFLITALGGLVGYLMARAISNPLVQMTDGMSTIMEKGDMGIRIRGLFGGEIGVLSKTFNKLLNQLQEAHEKLAASEKRMKEELTVASTVQDMLFPPRSSEFLNLSLASFIEASTETGGDWFGYGEGKSGKDVTVLIGDVTGHGVPAALITAITNGFFRGVSEAAEGINQVIQELESLRKTDMDPKVLDRLLEKFGTGQFLTTADQLKMLNDVILTCTNGSLLMTFFASVFDPKTRKLHYANAGHNRPFFCRYKDGKAKVGVLQSDASQRLGENREVTFSQEEIQLEKGDSVIWYTDGILECVNEEEEMFGKRRMMSILKKSSDWTPEKIRDELVRESYAFYGDQPRDDDITLVVGKVS